MCSSSICICCWWCDTCVVTVAVVFDDAFVGDMLQLTEGLSTIRQSHDKLCTQLMTDIHTMTADNQLGKDIRLLNNLSVIVQYKCVSIRDYHYHQPLRS